MGRLRRARIGRGSVGGGGVGRRKDTKGCVYEFVCVCSCVRACAHVTDGHCTGVGEETSKRELDKRKGAEGRIVGLWRVGCWVGGLGGGRVKLDLYSGHEKWRGRCQG